ncbi:hypothetical protein RB195_022732 [Necator americanus]|uniref:Uncharacterized protein n=1 Tax=Necator americanus TaxID=51031 RepID=A0ABR1EIL0_NECAM
MPVVDPHHQRSQVASLPIPNSPYHDVRIADLDSTIYGDGEAYLHGRKLLRGLPGVCHSEDLYAEIDVVYRWMTREKKSTSYTAIESGYSKSSSLFWSYTDETSRSLCSVISVEFSGSGWKRPPGRKRKSWAEVVKEDVTTLGVDRQFSRGIRFHMTWNSDEWIDSVQALAED